MPDNLRGESMYKKSLKHQFVTILLIISFIMSPIVTYAASEASNSSQTKEQRMLDFIDKVAVEAGTKIENKTNTKIAVNTNEPGGKNKYVTIFLTQGNRNLLVNNSYRTTEEHVIDWLQEPFKTDYKNHGQIKPVLEAYGFVRHGNDFFYTVSESAVPDILKEIDLIATPHTAENYIELDWNAPSKSTFYNYTVFRKDQTSNEFQSVGSIDIDDYKKAGKKVKVLNIYPTNGVPIVNCGHKNENGSNISMYKSANLKCWMEHPQTGAPEGYGQGVISVDSVTTDQFNNRPDIIDDYDVAYMGHWDSNANEGLTNNGLQEILHFIDEGKGFLVGHDTTAADILDKNNKFSLGGSLKLRERFNIQTGYSSSNEPERLVKEEKIDFNKNFNWGGSQIEIAKTGALMNYPWVIKNPLTVPYTHTAAQVAYGDVWFTFKNGGWFNGRNKPPTDKDLSGGAINFYLTTWNNTGIIQTGHSNGEAKPDEQKILANVLFNLAQKTTETRLDDRRGQDTTPPTRPEIGSAQIDPNRKLKINISKAAQDVGTEYTYKVKAVDISNSSIVIESAPTTATIQVGLKGYIALASNDANLTSNDIKIMKADQAGIISVDAQASATYIESTSSANLDFNLPIFIYVSAVDNVNNVSEPFKYQYNPNELSLMMTQHDDNNGVKWVELSWNKPEWLKEYTLYRENSSLYKEGNDNEDIIGKYIDKNESVIPNEPKVIKASYDNGKIVAEFLPAKDAETTYTYKIAARNLQTTYESETVQGIVASGIKGYKITVDNNKDTKPSGDILTDIEEVENKLQWVSNDLGPHFSTQNAYMHISAVDNGNNESLPVHIRIAVSYPEVKLTVTDSANKPILSPYSVDTFGPDYKENILNPSALVVKEDQIALFIQAKQLESQKYQFIKAESKPNFPVTSDSKWIDLKTFEYSYKTVAEDWSEIQTTTTGNLGISSYEEIRMNAKLGMPDEAGSYYLVVKVQPKEVQPPRNILYGPFTVGQSILPNVYKKTPNNFTLPEGYSHIDYDASFDTDFKEVKITLDMDELISTKAPGTSQPLVVYNLKQAVLTINSNVGGSRLINLKNSSGSYSDTDYQVTVSDADSDGANDKIVISFKEEIFAGSEYSISVLMSTKFEKGVKYGPETTAGTYLNMIKTINEDTPKKVTAIVEGKPKVQEATAEASAEYREEPVTVSGSKIVMYMPMSKIN
ncbi:MAG: TPR-repeat-containing protein [Clostridia bacterium]|jgi:hypothetical protein|nr:TPR-repeat-containing protein [Clostridia bacterium]